MIYEISDGRSFARVAASSPSVAALVCGFVVGSCFFVSYPCGRKVYHYWLPQGALQVSCES